MKIVTDEIELRKPNELVKSLEEAQEVSEQLFLTLMERGVKTDVGLAAPQIGIHKRVCVVRARESIVLVNPRIVDAEGETWYREGCISFPGKSVRTKRFTDIVVEVDWLGIGNDVMQEWSGKQKIGFASELKLPIDSDPTLLECVAVQHEIDHLNGMLMFDREWKVEQRKVDKVKPNEPCFCGSGKKYKKCCMNT